MSVENYTFNLLIIAYQISKIMLVKNNIWYKSNWDSYLVTFVHCHSLLLIQYLQAWDLRIK